MLLRELKQTVTQLKGVGERTAGSLRTPGIYSVSDLLLHYPKDYEDRITPAQLSSVHGEGYVNTIVKVVSHDYFGWGAKRTLKVTVKDQTSSAVLICFGRLFLKETFKIGEVFYLYGFFQIRYGELQSVKFETEKYSTSPKNFGKILPVYPLSEGLSQGFLRRIIIKAVESFAKYLENEIPDKLKKKYGLLSKGEAVANIHFPENIDLIQRSRKTLIYEELFYLQIIVGRRSFKRKKHFRDKRILSSKLQTRLIQRLPFNLTEDQETVLSEINNDLAGIMPMGRLLQGDVGSGKTLIAFLSSLLCIEAGMQVAFMAPTELLAKQHAENGARLLAPLGISLAFLSGNVKDKSRENLLKALENGEIDMIIGTHALFTKTVKFKSLSLVIIDEQHKFGVLQRIALMEKGSYPDLLLMTATPIPRTLALTAFGDLDISTIKTMPPGRKPVITHLAEEDNDYKVYNWVKKRLAKKQQAYFVYPLIDESLTLSLKDAQTMFDHLRQNIFPEFVLGLIHSRVPEDEKIKLMNDFTEGKLDILVATSVVEVGIDVPNATVMVIEHAERFGLSALHQLRGRVGRGELQSYAFLVYSKQLNDDGKKRLKVMKESSDGFYIAEEDLKIRGPGEVAGKKQSGFLNLGIANLINDIDILKIARTDSFEILKEDPGLLLPENKVIRDVLNRCPPFSNETLKSG